MADAGGGTRSLSKVLMSCSARSSRSAGPWITSVLRQVAAATSDRDGRAGRWKGAPALAVDGLEYGHNIGAPWLRAGRRCARLCPPAEVLCSSSFLIMSDHAGDHV